MPLYYNTIPAKIQVPFSVSRSAKRRRAEEIVFLKRNSLSMKHPLPRNLPRSAVKAFLWNHGMFMAETVVSFLTTWVLARYLAPEKYGIYSSLMAFAMLGLAFISFGYENSINVYIPRLERSPDKIRFLMVRMILYRALAAGVLSAAVFLLSALKISHLVPQVAKIEEYLVLAVVYSGFNLLSGLLVRALQTIFKIKSMTIIRTALHIGNLAAFWILLVNGRSITEILIVSVLTSAVFTAILVYQTRDMLFGHCEKFNTREMFRFGYTTWLSKIFSEVLGKNSDIAILLFYNVASASIGFYNMAFSLVGYARIIATKGMTGIILSAFSGAYAQGGKQSAARWWNIVLKYQIFVCTPGIVFITCFSTALFSAFLPAYTAVTPMIMTYGSLVLIATFAGGSVNTTVFSALGRVRLIFIYTCIGGIINIALDLILIYFWGALGALIATSFSAIITSIISLTYIFRQIPAVYPFRFCVLIVLSLGIASCAAFFIPGNGPVSFCLKLVLFCSAYLLSAFLLKPLDYTDIEKITSASRKLGDVLKYFGKGMTAL
jgi:O-antigen/teichoic acid export membrane protein